MTLCGVAVGNGWLEEIRFSNNAARKANEDALDAEINAWVGGHKRDELAERLSNAGVIAAPVLDAHEVADDETLRECGFIVEIDHPEAGTHPHSGIPVQFSGTPVMVSRHAPLQGQHTQEVLERLLGLEEDEYADLVNRRITGAGPS